LFKYEFISAQSNFLPRPKVREGRYRDVGTLLVIHKHAPLFLLVFFHGSSFLRWCKKNSGQS